MNTPSDEFYDRINPARDLQAALARCACGDPVVDERGWWRRCPHCSVFYCKKSECMDSHYQSPEHKRIIAGLPTTKAEGR